MKTLSEKPMKTADGVDIKEGMIVYTIHVHFSQYSKKEEMAEVKANRVFHVNNKDRCFRYRCTQGCETEISLREGCGSTKVYGKVVSAKNIVSEKIDQKIKDIKQDAVNKKEDTKRFLDKNKLQQEKMARFKTNLRNTVKLPA